MYKHSETYLYAYAYTCTHVLIVHAFEQMSWRCCDILEHFSLMCAMLCFFFQNKNNKNNDEDDDDSNEIKIRLHPITASE